MSDLTATSTLDPWILREAVRVARDRVPGDDDLAELLTTATGVPLGSCAEAVERAHALGLIDYRAVTETLVIHGQPTAAGLALLDSGSLVADRPGQG